jgi:ATP/maltotriose-dependent transcriptional regulator MalT
VQVAREAGALVRLQFALQFLALSHLVAGDLAAAAQAMQEERAIAEAAGTSPVAYTDMTLAAWRGEEASASALIDRARLEAQSRGLGRMEDFARFAAALLFNGIGRYEAAHEAVAGVFEDDRLGYTPIVVPEVAEAASRTGDAALLQAALEWMAERAAATPTDWALGIEARVRALASDGEEAERGYRESIDRLARTRIRGQGARGHLLYGEWLRRESRRVEAREQLRVAREQFLSMGAEGFAERARHELLATGEKVRKRRDDTRDELTPQELHIARLARDGRTNPEIGAELFLSPRTVEWHLKKVFTKLGISSRRALRDALGLDVAAV